MDAGSGSPVALTSLHLSAVHAAWWGWGGERKHTNGPERAREECGPHHPWGLKRDRSRGDKTPKRQSASALQVCREDREGKGRQGGQTEKKMPLALLAPCSSPTLPSPRNIQASAQSGPCARRGCFIPSPLFIVGPWTWLGTILSFSFLMYKIGFLLICTPKVAIVVNLRKQHQNSGAVRHLSQRLTLGDLCLLVCDLPEGWV